MARRRRHDIDPAKFTTGEVARATGLALRSIINFCDQDLLPASGGGRRSTHREMDMAGLIRAAIIGAFNRSGMEITTAARLTEAVSSSPEFTKKLAMAGLERLNTNLPVAARTTNFDQTRWGDASYHLHAAIRETPQYEQGVALKYDHVLKLVEGRRVALSFLTDTEGGLMVSQLGTPLVDIRNLGKPARDLDLQVLHGQSPEMTWSGEQRVTLHVNVSLTIRDALDTLGSYRKQAAEAQAKQSR